MATQTNQPIHIGKVVTHPKELRGVLQTEGLPTPDRTTFHVHWHNGFEVIIHHETGGADDLEFRSWMSANSIRVKAAKN